MAHSKSAVSALFASLCVFAPGCDERLVGDEEVAEAGDADGMDEGELLEPTGQACETPNEEVSCSDGSSAYCSFIETDLEFGPCIPDAELECDVGASKPTYVDELCGQMYATCRVEGGIPMWVNETCDTPLVLRFDQSPIEMIAAESTPMATFDVSMTADSCITTDWPTAATPWLAIDLDRNGAIDGGNELFGSGTQMADGSHARHGFMALAALDADGNGRVDQADPRFDELVLWRDHDADRRSLAWELESLASVGISSVPVEWTSEIECDERGNCGNQRASFEYAGGTAEIVDLYLACH